MGVISAVYRNLMKPQLFKRDPEDVHDSFTKMGNRLGRYSFTRALTRATFQYRNQMLTQEVKGIKFDNPIGLSAGFDKDANLHNILYPVGFGFMQVGSITLKPYEGNPKPRLVRLPNSKGLVVYYGLKNIGVDKIIERVKNKKDENFVLSMSVAKTNCDSTSTEQGGIEDYVGSLMKLKKENVGDFYTINISCPNTFGGEPFTTSQKLDSLLTAVDEVRLQKPIFIKMPINLPWDEYKGLVETSIKHKIDGVIIGNLTKVRDPDLVKDPIPEEVKGGISGVPTQKLSDELIKRTYQNYGDKLVIIGVGGVFNGEDAYRKIRNGATLVQLITGMIYEGPQLIGDINRDLVKYLRRDGFNNVSEAIGEDAK